MPAEVEAKFRADSAEVLDALEASGSLAFARLGRPQTTDEVDRYLDTADARLEAAGWACRLRRRGDEVWVSLKGPAVATDGVWHHHRPEIEGPATPSPDPGAWPPSDARDRLAALTGGAPLVERFTLRQRRTERAVLADGRRVGTLSLDRVGLPGGSQTGDDLFVVELELTDERSMDRDGFDALASALLARGGVTPEPRTTLEHALARLAAR